jgi:hypothetical protein
MNEGSGMIGRLTAWYADWRRRRRARAKKRSDDRIRRAVEKEWARDRRQMDRARKRQARGNRR